MLVLAALLAGCSALPSWVNPFEWYRGARDAFLDDDKARESRAAKKKAQEMTLPDTSEPFPRLSTVPDRPRIMPSDERTSTEQDLRSDRDRAKSSDAEIRSRGDRTPAAKARPVLRMPRPPPMQSTPPPPPALKPPPKIAPALEEPPGSDEGLSGLPDADWRDDPLARAVFSGAPPADVLVAQGDTGSRAAPIRDFGSPPPDIQVVGRSVSAGLDKRGFPALSLVASVRFAVGESGISPAARRTLGRVAETLKATGGRLRIVGHANRRGTERPDLSRERANAVVRELVRLGVAPATLRIGGAPDPAGGRTDDGVPEERRVDVFLLPQG